MARSDSSCSGRSKSGANQQGQSVHYYFNYSARAATFRYPHADGTNLLENQAVAEGSQQQLPPWGVLIVLED